jgi:hypothetical protein
MKRLLVIVALLIATIYAKAGTFPTNISDTVTQQSDGTYSKAKAKSKEDTGTDTGKVYKDSKGNSYPIMKSKNGKYFVVRTSKAGNQYKQYIVLK